MGKYPMKRCDPVETWPEADIVGEIERDLETGRDPMIEEIAVVHAITDEFHLKGTQYDHDQQTHAGGSGSGAVTADFAEAPPGYTEEAQKAWRIGYEYLSNHEMPDWWNGTEVMDDDGLPKRENQVAHDWDRPGVGDEIDAWKETVGDDVEHGVWMIGRAAESLRRQRIQESISMNEIDLAAAEERWGKYRIEPGGNGSAQWEDLPPVLYHATSALSAIAESGVLKTRAEIGGSKVAAGLGGGSDDTISFTDDRTVADGIARSLHEVRRAVTMPGDELMAELEARSGDWWPDVLDSARSVHGIRDVPETIEQRYNLFRSYAAYRERKEGILDPLFFNVDPNRLAAMDPAEIGVVSVAPAVAGAKGYRVSALGEWRIPTGRAVTITATEYEEDRGGFSVRVVQQFHLQGQHNQKDHGNRGTSTKRSWELREGDVIVFDPETAVTNAPGFKKGDRLVVDAVVKSGPGRSAAGRAKLTTDVGVIVNGKIGPTWRAETEIEVEADETFHLQGQHNQKDHGRRYGRTRALSEPDGGMTLDTEHLQPMTTGWAVAIKATDRLLLASTAFDTDGNPSKQLVRLVRDRLEAARTSTPVEGTRLALGGWHNPADGKIEINVTVVFPKTEQERARRFAVDNDQISMANLDAITAGDWDHAIVDTGGTGGDRRTEDELAVRRRRQFRLSQGVIQ